jgi:predicted deacylase
MMIHSLDDVGKGRTNAQLFVTDRTGGDLSIPLIAVSGRKDGPTLLVLAAVHPTEYAGVEAALRFSDFLKPEELIGRVVIIPFVNLPGFNMRIPGGSPEDLVDIFRIFPGGLGSSIAYTIAHVVFQRLVLKSDFVIDLHGGELNESETVPLAWFSKTGNSGIDAKSKSLAVSFCPDFLLDSAKVWFDDKPAGLPQGLLIHEAATRGIPAIIGEAGGSGRSGGKGSDRLYDGLLNACRSLGMLRGKARKTSPPVLTDLSMMMVKQDGLLHCQVRAGQKVASGDLLAEVRRWDGKVLQKIRAPFAGVVTITVNWLPVRSGEYALAMAKLR